MNYKALKQILPEDRIKTKFIDLVSYASDAGFYYLLPKAIVQVISEAEVQALFQFSQAEKIPLVFRTGGTSLSGQSITDGILVDLSKYWNRVQIEDNGKRVRVQPGVTGAMVNARLAAHKCKIGPDPSSISAAMMGGILSNNASGMCCGVKFNSYHTTRSIRFMLTDGKAFDTARAGEQERFVAECPALANELSAIRGEIVGNEILYDRIRHKYQTKNTVGYSLNAFVDYEQPLDIFAHLLIGAEGTLAFISEAVLDTIVDEPYKATALLYFQDIFSACQAIIPLTNAGAAMVELMDRASLRAIEHLPGMDPFVKTCPEAAAALLIEFQQSSTDELQQQVNAFLATTDTYALLNAPRFTSDPVEREFYWKVRKGLFPAVGAVRASGTTVILEDVAFPIETLGHAILALQDLFRTFNYTNAIIFGHAKDGNIHFVVTQSFNNAEEIERYDRFLRAVVELVVTRFNGTLKAEHGTGRNMSPFVQTEWGPEAYVIMQRIKRAADPHALLNPDVIINSSNTAHIEHLKEMPAVEEEVDRCIECGYCEPVCPSRDLTTTPRRRIVARRAIAGLKAAGDNAGANRLLKEYKYEGMETCAVDGLCANACPVDINTGDLIKRLRRENHSSFANAVAVFTTRNFRTVIGAARLALKAGRTMNKLFGRRTMENTTRLFRKLVPSFPLWSPVLPAPPSLSPVKKHAALQSGLHTIVYFPACISRLLGSGNDGKKSLLQTFMDVAGRAGIRVKIIDRLQGACCGQIYSSKGFSKAYAITADRIVQQLWLATEEGKYPVVMDVSSCTYTLHHLRPVLSVDRQQQYDRLRIIDSVDFLHDMVLPVAESGNKKSEVVLHPVCSLKKMYTTDKLLTVARHFAEQVTVPLYAGCCGMAGDRGFLFPELTASATQHEAREVQQKQYEGYYSSTRTCELALSEAVGKNYESILYLVDECWGRE